MNNAPHKALKKKCFWDKKIEKKQQLEFIWTYENMIKYILTIQKSLTIRRLNFSKKRFFI
jgi:hypothetical protein